MPSLKRFLYKVSLNALGVNGADIGGGGNVSSATGSFTTNGGGNYTLTHNLGLSSPFVADLTMNKASDDSIVSPFISNFTANTIEINLTPDTIGDLINWLIEGKV